MKETGRKDRGIDGESGGGVITNPYLDYLVVGMIEPSLEHK